MGLKWRMSALPFFASTHTHTQISIFTYLALPKFKGVVTEFKISEFWSIVSRKFFVNWSFAKVTRFRTRFGSLQRTRLLLLSFCLYFILPLQLRQNSVRMWPDLVKWQHTDTVLFQINFSPTPIRTKCTLYGVLRLWSCKNHSFMAMSLIPP